MSITVEKLTKQFVAGEMPACREVSFSAPTGAITSLLGPSGSGKTTALRLIAGLETPNGGRVRFLEEDVTHVPVQKRGVGFVFQGYALFEHLTVRRNIAFGMEMQRASKGEIQTRVEELLELVQLGGYGTRYPQELSGGQRQRVAFARALATRPKVLLLDEPFGALDARVRLELREWLHQLHDKMPLTTILVTHDQEEALELSQRVVVMHQGRVEQVGTPLEIYDHPATAFVASFIGNPSVLKGQVQDGRASAGPVHVDAPAGASDGTTVHAFVRPHEIKLRRLDDPTACSATRAEVARLTRIGSFVKAELKLPSGETMTVHLSHEDQAALGLKAGELVCVDLVGAKVFAGDYAI